VHKVANGDYKPSGYFLKYAYMPGGLILIAISRPKFIIRIVQPRRHSGGIGRD